MRSPPVPEPVPVPTPPPAPVAVPPLPEPEESNVEWPADEQASRVVTMPARIRPVALVFLDPMRSSAVNVAQGVLGTTSRFWPKMFLFGRCTLLGSFEPPEALRWGGALTALGPRHG